MLCNNAFNFAFSQDFLRILHYHKIYLIFYTHILASFSSLYDFECVSMKIQIRHDSIMFWIKLQIDEIVSFSCAFHRKKFCIYCYGYLKIKLYMFMYWRSLRKRYLSHSNGQNSAFLTNSLFII